MGFLSWATPLGRTILGPPLDGIPAGQLPNLALGLSEFVPRSILLRQTEMHGQLRVAHGVIMLFQEKDLLGLIDFVRH